MPPFDSMRIVPALALLIAASAALAACGSEKPESASRGESAELRALAGAPPPLARIHAQRNELLGGGAAAFKRRLRELRGRPVVVNKWASWCGPCRAEFPFFQELSVERGKEIAFLGVNSNDSDGAARRFLEELPVSYPSYKDPDQKVAAVFRATAAFPATAFYDSKGELAFVRQGSYATKEKLAEEIDRHAR